MRGWEPLHLPMRGGAQPLREQVVRLGSSLLPVSGPTRPTPGVPFVSRRKEPKACRGCAHTSCFQTVARQVGHWAAAVDTLTQLTQ